ncbi:phosphonatase-like hydrolase [Olivibacter sp. CPCC 100613]|uniref:phosphonatase-like hydrolase n=1 Tax=Olivibacter sp. CPCC 100613 TaxID=3079931 RepID=UPI002FF88F34
MHNKIKMVVFDMAGTTVDEDNIVYKTLLKAINEAGFDFSLDQVLAEGAGKEKKQAIRSVLTVYANLENEGLVESIYENFKQQLDKAYEREEIVPQKNAEKLFQVLKEQDILVVLNTGYDRLTAQSIIDKLGWKEGKQIDGLVTASDVPKNRPYPDMIHFAMKRFNIVDSKQVAKIGDSTIDIEEGQNAGCGLTIGITTGAHTAEQLESAHPDKIIGDLIDVLSLLDNVPA